MKTHELKILPEYFKEVLLGNKNFEIRKNDRNFQVGDYVELREYDPTKYFYRNGDEITEKEAKKQFDLQRSTKLSIADYHFTQRSIKKIITFITDYEQKPGYVVFGTKARQIDDFL